LVSLGALPLTCCSWRQRLSVFFGGAVTFDRRVLSR
jgi:hypothetical protein